jgi:DNA polymerase-3 subunit delta
MSAGLSELQQQLERRDLHRVYFFYGAEEHLRREALELLKRAVLAPDAAAFNYAEFNSKSHSMSEVVHVAQTFPMMAPLRMVVLTGVETVSAEQQASLVEYLERPAAKTVLALTATEPDRRTSLYRTLSAKASTFEFAPLKGAELERWAERYMSSRGRNMSAASLRKLIGLAGDDLSILTGEIDKLFLYTGEAKTVPDPAIDELVRGTRQHGVFELTGAIGRRDVTGALRLLGNLIESGEPPLVLVNLMARHFRQTIIVQQSLQQGKKPREAATAAGIPPYFADEFIRQARGLPPQAAKRIYTRLAEADHRLKSSNVEPRMLLESLICSLK